MKLIPSPSSIPSPERPPTPPPSPKPTRQAPTAWESFTEDDAKSTLATVGQGAPPPARTTQEFGAEENLVRLYVAAGSLGYSLLDVPGDGDCALHAVVFDLRPFGVDESVGSLRAALIRVANTDDEFRANVLLSLEAAEAGQGEARFADCLKRTTRRGTFLDNMALAALATAIARPIVVFAPLSRRVETHTPSARVSSPGAPVHLAINPELVHINDKGDGVVRFGGHYLAAVPGGDDQALTHVTHTARLQVQSLPALVHGAHFLQATRSA